MDPFFARPKRKADDLVSSESEAEERDREEEDEEEHVSETANEKRVRLAREMIETVRGDSDDPEAEENVSKRLQKLAAVSQGGRGVFVPLGEALEGAECEWGAVGDSVELGGHSHVPCCVAVQDGLVASGAKGGGLLVHRLDGSVVFRAEGNGKNDAKAVCWAGAGHLAVARRGAAAVQLWSVEEGAVAAGGPVAQFVGHSKPVSGLCCDGTQLYAAGSDGTLRVFDVRSQLSMGTHFGHLQDVTSIVLVGKDRVLTSSEDKTVHLWKLEQEQQAVFRGPKASIECVAAHVRGAGQLNAFCSGQQDGSLALWSGVKKKPVCVVPAAHGGRWIVAVAHLKNTDLIASGSYDGFVRLWRFTADLSRLTQVAAIAAAGFVNSLHLVATSSLSEELVSVSLVVALGTEHRSGRWWSTRRDADTLGDGVCRGAVNSLFCYPLSLPNPAAEPLPVKRHRQEQDEEEDDDDEDDEEE